MQKASSLFIDSWGWSEWYPLPGNCLRKTNIARQNEIIDKQQRKHPRRLDLNEEQSNAEIGLNIVESI